MPPIETGKSGVRETIHVTIKLLNPSWVQARCQCGEEHLFVADPDGSLGEVTRTGALSPAGGAFTSLRVIGVAGAGTVAFRGSVTSGPDGLAFLNYRRDVSVQGYGRDEPTELEGGIVHGGVAVNDFR